MKYVPLQDTPDLKGREIAELVLKHTGQAGANLEALRKRARLWDALDANTDPCGIQLEDADADLLKTLYAAFPWGMATRELLKHIEAVDKAQAPSAVLLPTN